MNLVVYFILPVLLVTICKRTCFKIVHGPLAIPGRGENRSRFLCNSLSEPFDKMYTRKNGSIKVAFLLKKSLLMWDDKRSITMLLTLCGLNYLKGKGMEMAS